MAIKECVVCGGSFDANFHNRTLCSEACKDTRKRERSRVNADKWRKTNPDAAKAVRERYLERKPHVKVAWQKNNPDKVRESRNKYNAKLRAAHSIINRIKEEGLSALL